MATSDEINEYILADTSFYTHCSNYTLLELFKNNSNRQQNSNSNGHTNAKIKTTNRNYKLENCFHRRNCQCLTFWTNALKISKRDHFETHSGYPTRSYYSNAMVWYYFQIYINNSQPFYAKQRLVTNSNTSASIFHFFFFLANVLPFR